MSRVIVAGSGIAGLTAALHLVDRHEVVLVTKDRLGASNTEWAQGGIAGVIGPDDTVDSHVADTLTAGAGHCDAEAVRALCESGGDAINALAEAGVAFDTDPTGAWARGLEGAHSHPRIFHSGGDATGAAITAALTAQLRTQAAAGRVEIIEDAMLVDIVTEPGSAPETVNDASASTHTSAGTDVPVCARAATGITVLRGDRYSFLSADAVVLATGGAGQLFAHTTNPAAATGDGLAAAIRAGAEVADLEFFQFHPTALTGPGFLISEAVRGAGALLLDEAGHRFMAEVDDRAELASRDVVALALHRRQAAQDGRPCFLDARAVPDAAARFPSITAGLATHGFDLSHDLIPVTPAAHYFMGGVSTDRDGRTSIGRLFAIGEVACTRVHGANRLASNSLLEGAVFAARAAAAIDDLPERTEGQRTAAAVLTPNDSRLDYEAARTLNRDHNVPLSTVGSLRQTALTRTELQTLTWAYLGVERTDTGLRTLLGRLGEGAPSSAMIGNRAHRTVLPSPKTSGIIEPNVEDLETANLALIAKHMALHALAREHSLGAHTRTDTAPTSPTDAASTSTQPPSFTTAPSTALLQEATAC